MSTAKTVTFYLPARLRQQAMNGNHNFINKVTDVLQGAGLDVAFDGDGDLERLRAMARPGYGLHLMQEPVNARGLTFRKTYMYPFWHIEKQAERWDWPVAQDQFDAASVDSRKAANFYRFWQNRLFDDTPQASHRGGFVYVPLQGQLLRHRSFQHCSPIDMIEAVLQYDARRTVIMTLHPNETYTSQEQHALEALINKHDRLRMGTNDTKTYLQQCDYVVTQNSSAGFKGYFFGKPLILFGQIDFHHIALRVDQLGVAETFAKVGDHEPDYAAYLYWFLQKRAINAGRPEATDRIRNTLRQHGWPV